MTQITVLKRNLEGEVTWQYEGRLLNRQPSRIVLEAFFDRADMPLMDVVLKRRDHFIETFYSDRWYNVFEIYDRDDGGLKGWYCNICFPAIIAESTVSYVDLALDLWVSRSGEQTILDEDEFYALSLDDLSRGKAFAALEELQQTFPNQKPPA